MPALIRRFIQQEFRETETQLQSVADAASAPVARREPRPPRRPHRSNSISRSIRAIVRPREDSLTCGPHARLEGKPCVSRVTGAPLTSHRSSATPSTHERRTRSFPTEELRDRLLRSLIAIGIVFVCLFPFANDLYDLLAFP